MLKAVSGLLPFSLNLLSLPAGAGAGAAAAAVAAADQFLDDYLVLSGPPGSNNLNGDSAGSGASSGANGANGTNGTPSGGGGGPVTAHVSPSNNDSENHTSRHPALPPATQASVCTHPGFERVHPDASLHEGGLHESLMCDRMYGPGADNPESRETVGRTMPSFLGGGQSEVSRGHYLTYTGG